MTVHAWHLVAAQKKPALHWIAQLLAAVKTPLGSLAQGVHLGLVSRPSVVWHRV
jgi:hypothetical protein